MIVDTAHMNHQSMMDVVHYSTKPILNSHSNIRTLHDHTRNVEDEFIDALEKNG
jgi:membrane dipeptidase